MKKFKLVVISFCMGENEPVSCEVVEGNSKEEVIEREFKEYVDELKKDFLEDCDEDEGEEDFDMEFLVKDSNGFSCGEESGCYVIGEDEEMYNVFKVGNYYMLEDNIEYSDDEWSKIGNFLDKMSEAHGYL